MSIRKQSNKNRKISKDNGEKTFNGETCRFCLGKTRWIKRNSCYNCYTETGIPKDFEKRKKQLISKLKSQAKLKGVDFNITKEDINWVEICPIMQIKLNYFTTGFREHNTASFDRKDTNKGYIKGNVFVISNIANMRKSDLTIEQLERMIYYVKETTSLY
jgi:hypothetical protein